PPSFECESTTLSQQRRLGKASAKRVSGTHWFDRGLLTRSAPSRTAGAARRQERAGTRREPLPRRYVSQRARRLLQARHGLPPLPAPDRLRVRRGFAPRPPVEAGG